MAIQQPYDEKDRPADRPVELTPVEARQGLLGRPVLMVLVVGLVLALIAWAAAEYWGMAIDRQTPADTTPVTAPANTPVTEDKNMIDNNVPAGEKVEPAPAIVDPTPPANQ